jgi:CPA2 family monovalent cation:H+ antiporter-2
VRTADDSRLDELMAAGATEVVPETFEASLMLASHALLLLKQPVSRVVRTIAHIRNDRYASLRGLLRGESALPETDIESIEELKTVVLPPGAWAVGRTLEEAQRSGCTARVESVLRHGIVGRNPDADLRLQQGDDTPRRCCSRARTCRAGLRRAGPRAGFPRRREPRLRWR